MLDNHDMLQRSSQKPDDLGCSRSHRRCVGPSPPASARHTAALDPPRAFAAITKLTGPFG
jgi:hypothetical protein